MSARDNLLALLSALILGFAFILVKVGVTVSPPLLITALRFFFAAVPAVFFIAPPKTAPRLVILYGLLIGVGQFGLLFLSVGMGMPISLASLVIQLQAFITVALAWFLLGERPSSIQILAGLIALAGIMVIGSERLHGASLIPFLLIIIAAFCWASGNIVGKKAGRVDMFAFTIWSSLAAPLPLLALSLLFEHDRALYTLAHPTWLLTLCVVVLAYGATVIGFGLWSRVLAHNPAASVAPFALLIPVIGMIAGYLIFNEPLNAGELFGAALIMLALSINVFGARFLLLFGYSQNHIN